MSEQYNYGNKPQMDAQPYAQQPYDQSYGKPLQYDQQPFGQYQQPPQGGYYPPPQQQGQYQAPSGPPPEKNSFANTDNKPKAKWNDLWATLLFIAQFCAFIAVSVISLRAWSSSDDLGSGLGGHGGNGFTLNKNTAYLLCLVAAAGVLFSVIFLALIRAFTKIVLEICLILSVVITVAYAIYLWVRRYYSGAIIFTIFAVISVLVYFPMRKRIPLSRILLKTIMRVCDMYKSTYMIAVGFTVVQGFYSIWWSFTVAASYQKWAPSGGTNDAAGGSSGNGAIICVIIFLVFHYYWTTQFLTNLCLTTEAGIFGTWYFTGGKAAGSEAPTKVSWGAFKRASTYSFGSIAFGSLIVALLDLLRAALSFARQEAAQQGDAFGMICACFAQCCVGCVRWAVNFFNRYAYIEIALYGKGYIAAAKDAWRLLKSRGIDALINDCLVGNVATIFSYVTGAICSAFAFLYLRILNPDYIQNNDSLTAIILLFAFVIGFALSYSLLYGALAAGTSTLFVGLAEDVGVLIQRDPELYQHIADAYPKIVTPV